MDRFIQALALVLIAVLLGITLNRQSKEVAIVLSVAVCSMVIAVVVSLLKPVVDFLNELQSLGKLDTQMVQILMKSVGISLLGEICGLICEDSGNAALGKAIRMLTAVSILWLSLPLLHALLELIQTLLGEL